MTKSEFLKKLRSERWKKFCSFTYIAHGSGRRCVGKNGQVYSSPDNDKKVYVRQFSAVIMDKTGTEIEKIEFEK